ncbi:MAG: hypothetical protein LQ348_003523 [Seirophora lacunosa]|nr:MAG: hypothetical protein LQ348_003523 [Seirophora lacunosa]
MSDDIQIEAQWVRDAIANENPDLPDSPEKQFEDSISNEQAQEILPIATSPEKKPEVANMINSMSLRKNKSLDKRSAPHKTEPSKKRKVARLGNQDAQLAGPGKTQKPNKLQHETKRAHSVVIAQAQRGQLKRPKPRGGPTHPKPGAGLWEPEGEEDDREHDQEDHLGDEHQARPQQFESVAIHDTPSKSPAGSDAAFKIIPESVLSSKGKADTQADKLSSAAAPPSPSPAASRRNTRAAQKPINRSIPGGDQQSDGSKVSKLQPGAASGSPVQGSIVKRPGRPRGSAPPNVPQSEAINGKHRHNLRNRDVDMSASGQPKQTKVDAVTAASTKRDVPASRSSKRTKGQPSTPAPSEGHGQPDHEVADSDESDSRQADGEGAERKEADNEEEESSSEATDSHQRDNGDSEELPDMQEQLSPELLGMDSAWREIKLAVRTIGTSARKGKETSYKPPLKTTQIERLIEVLDEAIKAYASPVPESSPEPTVLDKLAERQEKLVKGIEKSINKLSEINFKGNKNDLICDIYVHAIPQLVALLDKALEARSVQLSRKRHIIALEEIIRIQDVLASLCEKALQWRAKPSTIGPLMQPVRTMGPLLRSLQGRFKATLRERKRPLELKARRSEEENDERAWEQVQRDKQARNQEIWEAISQKSVGPRPGMVLQLSQARSQNAERRTGQAQWTDEQDLQLFMEFFAEGLQDLSGKDVYWPAAAFSR